MEHCTRSGLVVVLYGPTSTGKTKLSIELGLRVRRETGLEPVVLAADSRQVYRYMDIGTSKVTAGEMRGIRHEMLDVADPVRKLSLEAYVRMAREQLDASGDSVLPMIVGGTGVYVQALISDWDLSGNAALRASLRRDFPPGQVADAYEVLGRADPKAAAGLHPKNYEGILNALVRYMGRTSESGRRTASGSRLRVLFLGLDPGPTPVETAVARTFDAQVKGGLFQEIVDLAERYRLDEVVRRGAQSENQILHTSTYREFFERAGHARVPVRALSEGDRRLVRERAIENIRAYSRRQRTWFRKFPEVRMIRDSQQAYRSIVPALES